MEVIQRYLLTVILVLVDHRVQKDRCLIVCESESKLGVTIPMVSDILSKNLGIFMNERSLFYHRVLDKTTDLRADFVTSDIWFFQNCTNQRTAKCNTCT